MERLGSSVNTSAQSGGTDFSPSCLRVVIEESLRPVRDGSAKDVALGQELSAAVGFELNTPNGTFVRFDCRKEGCFASCGANDARGATITNPKSVPGKQWLDGCIEPSL